MTEVDLKLGSIRDFLDRPSLDGLLLRQASNLAWRSCGDPSLVNTVVAEGVASFLLTSSGRYLITGNWEVV